jgi:nifR3 family TIM-barrel protein
MITSQRSPMPTQASARDPLFGDAPMLAPLCGITDSPFRQICKHFGAGVMFTEMVSAEGLLCGSGGSWRMLEYRASEAPLVVQLASSEPDVMEEAARLVSDLGFFGININMGCPARKVVKGDRGAALMKDPPLAAALVARVRKATSLPLSVKMRTGWSASTLNYLELGRLVREAGADFLVLHPRTREQGYTGKADWDAITKLVEAMDIPVVGNGDILSAEDALRMKTQTGCRQVMIGRGSFGAPWIFRESEAALLGRPPLPPVTPQEIVDAIALQQALALPLMGRSATVGRMRGHILCYSKGLRDANLFRRWVVRLNDPEAQLQACRDFFLDGKVEVLP